MCPLPNDLRRFAVARAHALRQEAVNRALDRLARGITQGAHALAGRLAARPRTPRQLEA